MPSSVAGCCDSNHVAQPWACGGETSPSAAALQPFNPSHPGYCIKPHLRRVVHSIIIFLIGYRFATRAILRHVSHLSDMNCCARFYGVDLSLIWGCGCCFNRAVGPALADDHTEEQRKDEEEESEQYSAPRVGDGPCFLGATGYRVSHPAV